MSSAASIPARVAARSLRSAATSAFTSSQGSRSLGRDRVEQLEDRAPVRHREVRSRFGVGVGGGLRVGSGLVEVTEVVGPGAADQVGPLLGTELPSMYQAQD